MQNIKKTVKESFELAKEILGLDHIMVGLDYPFESMEEEVAFHESLDLTQAERELLYHGNAERLMGIAS